MAESITSCQKYNAAFARVDRKSVLEHALNIRKFEIELYWKRATYFWTLIAATFAAYFTLKSKDARLVSSIGLVLSTGWYLVNRDSKYWQENWERHVDSLEDEFIGPLYKTTIANRQFHFWNLCAGYPYSVSKVNQITSLFVLFVWLGIFLSSWFGDFLSSKLGLDDSAVRISRIAADWIPFLLTVCFFIGLFWFGRGGSQESAEGRKKAKKREVDFLTSPLVASSHEKEQQGIRTPADSG